MTQLDQDFIAACETAASLRPDLFAFVTFRKSQPSLEFAVRNKGCVIGVYDYGDVSEIKVTQDDIDRMAEAVGYRYAVMLNGGGSDGYWYVYERQNRSAQTHSDSFPDKLSAAKAAWIGNRKRD